ncbi:hypothetical protein ECG_03619 [Echinococcus granulosus]|nr:hypothetical protein ECG_03619 [Echinococcus granulosus]
MMVAGGGTNGRQSVRLSAVRHEAGRVTTSAHHGDTTDAVHPTPSLQLRSASCRRVKQAAPVRLPDLLDMNPTSRGEHDCTSATSVRFHSEEAASVSSKPAPMVIDSDTVENDNTANVDGDSVYHVSPSATWFLPSVEADDAPMNNGPAMEVDVPDHLRRVVDATNVVFTMENLNRRLESNDDANDVVNSTVNVVDSIGGTIPMPKTPLMLTSMDFASSDVVLHFPPHDKDVFVEAREFVGALPLFCTHNRISPNVHSQHIRAVSRSGLSLCFNLSLDLDNCEVIAPDSVSSPFTSIEAVAALSPCIGCLRWRVAVKGFNKECNALTKDISRWRRASKGGVWPLVPGAESAVCLLFSITSVLPRDEIIHQLAVFCTDVFCAAAKAPPVPLPRISTRRRVSTQSPVGGQHSLSSAFPVASNSGPVTLPNSTATATIPEYPSDCCDLSPCSPEVCDECYALVQQRRCNFVAARFYRQVAGPAEALAFNSTSPASSTSLETVAAEVPAPEDPDKVLCSGRNPSSFTQPRLLANWPGDVWKVRRKEQSTTEGDSSL